MVVGFEKRKQDVLLKKDKSYRRKFDKKIKKLCGKINQMEDYYTTSSCSGRIVLIKDSDKKESGLFLFVGHSCASNEKGSPGTFPRELLINVDNEIGLHAELPCPLLEEITQR